MIWHKYRRVVIQIEIPLLHSFTKSISARKKIRWIPIQVVWQQAKWRTNQKVVFIFCSSVVKLILNFLITDDCQGIEIPYCTGVWFQSIRVHMNVQATLTKESYNTQFYKRSAHAYDTHTRLSPASEIRSLTCSLHSSISTEKSGTPSSSFPPSLVHTWLFYFTIMRIHKVVKWTGFIVHVNIGSSSRISTLSFMRLICLALG